MEGYNFHHSRYYQSLLKNKFPPSVSSIKALSYSGSTRQLHCLNACSTQARVRGRLRVGERLYHLLGVFSNPLRPRVGHFRGFSPKKIACLSQKRQQLSSHDTWIPSRSKDTN